MAHKVMVICDGGLASLVALAIAAEETVAVGSVNDTNQDSRRVDGVAAVRSRSWQSTCEAQMRAVELQTQALGVPLVGGVLSPIADDADPSRGESATMELVNAAYFALRGGCSKLVWPIQVDRGQGEREAFDQAAEVCDRALLVSRLVLLDAVGAEVPEVTITTPMVDLDDDQVAEMAVDLAVPMPTLWWWSSKLAGERASYERTRWLAALEAAGCSMLKS